MPQRSSPTTFEVHSQGPPSNFLHMENCKKNTYEEDIIFYLLSHKKVLLCLYLTRILKELTNLLINKKFQVILSEQYNSSSMRVGYAC